MQTENAHLVIAENKRKGVINSVSTLLFHAWAQYR